MIAPDRVPRFIGGFTLVAGAVLAAAPRLATEQLGLDGQELTMRAVGLADLVLVPGLLRGRDRSAWMTARCALSLAQGAYLGGVAPGSTRPGLTRALGTVLWGLSLADAATAVQLCSRPD